MCLLVEFVFVLVSGELQVVVGDSLNLVVSVFSFNLPTTTHWTRGGRRIVGTTSLITSLTHTTITLESTLLLTNMMLRDTGNYTLTARNTLGMESKQFVVLVVGWFNPSKIQSSIFFIVRSCGFHFPDC